MKIGGFEISGKKVITGITLFTAGTIAAVMGKSKLTGSVSKSETDNTEDTLEENDDAEVIELSKEETDEPVIDVEENEPEEV